MTSWGIVNIYIDDSETDPILLRDKYSDTKKTHLK